MSDYISRQAAIEALAGWKISGEMILATVPSADVVERSSYESMEHTVAKLNEALSNSVEVVRCKDCVYREVKGEGMTHWFGCRIMEHNDDDWYCSYGERADK